ncbi:Major Facilitator Superfamily protein [Caulifigura coniformis]|uniref:Major Facilitator Superfamily protein n=1 Tax=Caulifigura coniformis TaxID=2527983 RepID=A0A517SAF1_9PLAN|nr:MFS transporter [Caulifigura coniformis]QDT53110.1 Major Facilitator Superfamily protein [Caulifigura coniformis]
MQNDEANGAGPTASPLEVGTRLAATQALFTAGHALTSGGFFNYFVSTYHPTATWLAILQAAPEFFETAGLFTRPIVTRIWSRKSLWILGLVLGRLAALAIPLIAIVGGQRDASQVLTWILVAVGFWYALQGLSYVAFLSWLSDLAPERTWGRIYSSRQFVVIVVTWIMSTLGGQAIRWQRGNLPPDQQFWFYVIAFTIGGLVAAASFVPMLSLPAIRTRPAFESGRFIGPLKAAVADRDFRFLLVWAAHMALAQGLTQAVITKYQIEVLKIPLEGYLQMVAVMLSIQAVLSLAAGQLSDRLGDRNLLFMSHLFVALAMVFPFLATPANPGWLFGAYITWGLFGVVNVVMTTLAWRLAPRSDNTSFLALFRPLTGLTAAIAAIGGGIWLDRLLKSQWSIDLFGRSWTGFHLLFLVSLVGRVTAPFWLLGIRKRQPLRIRPDQPSNPTAYVRRRE